MTNRVPIFEEKGSSLEFTAPYDDKANYIIIGSEEASAQYIFIRKGRKVLSYKKIPSNNISSSSVPAHMSIFFRNITPRTLAPISEDLILYRRVVRKSEKEELDEWKVTQGYK